VNEGEFERKREREGVREDNAVLTTIWNRDRNLLDNNLDR